MFATRAPLLFWSESVHCHNLDTYLHGEVHIWRHLLFVTLTVPGGVDHHLFLEPLGGAGETAVLVQGDKHMGWEGHLEAAMALKDKTRYSSEFCQTSSVLATPKTCWITLFF